MIEVKKERFLFFYLLNIRDNLNAYFRVILYPQFTLNKGRAKGVVDGDRWGSEELEIIHSMQERA